ncbi:MAG: hypothetical protein M1821_004911 [Bathelium mastoideum]|nr:MAG: hypothetical protein M1821_004911 [Bathelium mastoideum]KAI9689043.1 MAG: hypothetical protein M1822_000780 [Bathelium mastoideum]
MSTCDTGNDYDGRIGVRVSAIFVILFGSLVGSWFPVYAARHKGIGMPEWAFFIAKYFGSGVIIATAFIHLLAPACDALTDPCLTGPITEYDWAEGICLMSVFLLFFLELLTMRFANLGEVPKGQANEESAISELANPPQSGIQSAPYRDTDTVPMKGIAMEPRGRTGSHIPGEDHLGHAREHSDPDELSGDWEKADHLPESYAAQMTAIFILEFGVIFHSIFIGLTLAVAGTEFNTLYVVLIFHQTFEGLGLGTRLAGAPWPKSKRWTPYILGIGYAFSTPIAIAIGLGVRQTYPPNSQTTLIVNGCFDAVSAGILIYTGLVELMAHEFMFSPSMMRGPVKKLFGAFGLMCLGAGLMALLGKWA